MYYLDYSDQIRFGMQEPDDDHGEEQAEHSDFCPHCYADRQADHTRDCLYFEEQELPL